MAEAGVGPPVPKVKRVPWTPPPRSMLGDWAAEMFVKKPGEGYDLQKGEKPWQYERRMRQEGMNLKSKYPAFNIQPFKDDRERLLGEDGKGMTPEQRARRARWIKDQQLSPGEPLYEPIPRNYFRRLYGKPMTAIYMVKHNIQNKLMFWAPPKPFPPPSERKVLPFALLFYGIALAVTYSVKYHPKTWENHMGLDYLWIKSPDYVTIEKPMSPAEYADGGFSSRKALLNIKTSAAQ
ncbi:uncharacterized protein [Argopecten irradians]|uniref:uncharacterized protein n=1 Tax=Argopecten irradians TaxID=31199 RepID=UPI00372390B7